MQQIKWRGSGTTEHADSEASPPTLSNDDSLLFLPHPSYFQTPLFPIPDEGFGGPMGLDSEEPMSDYDHSAAAGGMGSGYYPESFDFGNGLDPSYHGNGSDDYNDWGSYPGQGKPGFSQGFPFVEETYPSELKIYNVFFKKA